MRYKFKVGDYVTYKRKCSVRLFGKRAVVVGICRREKDNGICYFIDFGEKITGWQHQGGIHPAIQGSDKIKSKTGIYTAEDKLTYWVDLAEVTDVYILENNARSLAYKFNLLCLYKNGEMKDLTVSLGKAIASSVYYGYVVAANKDLVWARLERFIENNKQGIKIHFIKSEWR